MKVLFVASEAHPLIKTGGLGDVCGSLPPALQSLGVDVRLMLPAYRDAVAHAGRLKTAARLELPRLAAPVAVLEGTLPGTRVKTWLVDFPPAFDRHGNPYLDDHGQPWHDNAARFALLARAARAAALGQVSHHWLPDVVHCHDWQTGLVPALLALEQARRPATIFTIHNLAYQGLFPRETLEALGLPPALWSLEALEFHGQLSFIKGGLVFADWITTVSPTYAREIQTPEYGCGLDGLLRYRATRISGILNGIDARAWNPARDPHLAERYSPKRLKGKLANKLALQRELGLEVGGDRALLGTVGRLVEQKGVDLLLEALAQIMQHDVQLAVLGTGEARFEQRLREMAARFPGRLAVLIGYDELLAHRITAGADIFLMPSRFEPCGLNQMYSQRYGTVPVVRRVGGLADTVIDATPENLRNGTATGVVFDPPDPQALVAAVARALALYADKKRWRRLMLAGMRRDFSWEHSAREYLRLYQQAGAMVRPAEG